MGVQSLLSRPRLGRAGIVQLPVGDIDANPNQPRKLFDDERLAELSQSIAEYGVISPLTVRLHYGRYELVSGERRLRAARMAGLKKVPCIILDVDMEESGLLALVENLQRQDLDFLEEARGIENLMRLYGLSQEECARRLGRSQSAVANKLRLLRLPGDVLDSLREHGLTERHGRALLRLPDDAARRAALEHILAEGLNVAQTDRYIDSLLAPAPEKPKSARKRSFILKDVRVFLNTVSHSLDVMKKGGIAAGMRQEETEDELIVTISIPKRPASN
ncbi:MAG TPA: ParB/RepB/Spo0J family partition protein [Candidatus Scatomorpha gallistercoris]|nr:ParB/RepB/Spo0J family partition protein [Candidatus Scatomorpha gallistercoris]